MKVAITGHTQGIGQSIFEELVNRSHQVQGYSKSTGWDISQDNVRSKLIDQIQDVDVFINNAYSPVAQFELLKTIVGKWQGTQKLVVNVGSKSIYADVVPDFMKSYVQDKQAQLDFIVGKRLTARPQILNLTLGLVNTKMSDSLEAQKLEPKDIAKLLVDVIELKDLVYVQDLMLDVPYQDWTSIRPKGR